MRSRIVNVLLAVFAIAAICVQGFFDEERCSDEVELDFLTGKVVSRPERKGSMQNSTKLYLCIATLPIVLCAVYLVLSSRSTGVSEHGQIGLQALIGRRDLLRAEAPSEDQLISEEVWETVPFWARCAGRVMRPLYDTAVWASDAWEGA